MFNNCFATHLLRIFPGVRLVVPTHKHDKNVQIIIITGRGQGVSLFNGMERWNGTVEWNGGMERWNGMEWNDHAYPAHLDDRYLLCLSPSTKK